MDKSNGRQVGFTRGMGELSASIRGTMALAGQPEYLAAAPWNLAVPSEPAAVVSVASVEDIAAVIRFAGGNGFKVAVRRTGHGATPLSDDTILVHTGRLNDCTVDASTRRARVGAGALWQQVLDAACPSGLAPVCGAAPGIGVAGYLTGGGLGPLSRTHGFSSDHVTALDVITGDGLFRHASPEEEPDLFWGLLGGKGTLGVVSAVELELPPATDFYGGALWFDATDPGPILTAWTQLAAVLPEAGTTSLAFMNLPDLPHLPPQIAGRPTLTVRFAWTGPEDRGAELLSELRSVAATLLDEVRVRPYSEVGQVHTDPARPMASRYHSALLHDFPAEAVDRLVEAVGSASPHTLVEIRALGGAIARAPRHASAVCHREAAYAVFMSGVPALDQEALDAHAMEVLSALARWTHPGLFANFAISDHPAVISRCFDEASRRRLLQLADIYDPAGVLAVGQVMRA